jgi:hypothetical protein
MKLRERNWLRIGGRVVVILAVVGWLRSGCDDSAERMQQIHAERADPSRPGKEGRLEVGILANTIDDWNQWDHDFKVNDRFGSAEMVNSDRVWTVKGGTKCLVTDAKGNMRRVRILEGEHIGRAGWTLA